MSKASKPITLYHFTCAHGYEGIARTGLLMAHTHPLMLGLGPLVWMTDDPAPTGESVGLNGQFARCDHLAYRYIIRTRGAVPWSEVRTRAPRNIVAGLEQFGEPDHWWIMRRSLLPSEFELDAEWRKVAV